MNGTDIDNYKCNNNVCIQFEFHSFFYETYAIKTASKIYNPTIFLVHCVANSLERDSVEHLAGLEM